MLPSPKPSADPSAAERYVAVFAGIADPILLDEQQLPDASRSLSLRDHFKFELSNFLLVV